MTDPGAFLGRAGLDLPAQAKIHAEPGPVTDLTSGELRQLDQRLTALLGFQVLVLPVAPGSTDIQPGGARSLPLTINL